MQVLVIVAVAHAVVVENLAAIRLPVERGKAGSETGGEGASEMEMKVGSGKEDLGRVEEVEDVAVEVEKTWVG